MAETDGQLLTPDDSSRDRPRPFVGARTGLRSRRPVAWTMGICFLALAALPFVTRSAWSGAPRDAEGFSDQPIPSLGAIAALALLMTLPYLVCPIARVASATVTDRQVAAATMRGTRSVRLDRLAHVGATELRYTLNLFLRDLDGRRLILVTSIAAGIPDDVRQAVAKLAADHPAAVSARARAHLRLPGGPGLARRALLGSLTILAFMGWALLLLAGAGLYLQLLG